MRLEEYSKFLKGAAGLAGGVAGASLSYLFMKSTIAPVIFANPVTGFITISVITGASIFGAGLTHYHAQKKIDGRVMEEFENASLEIKEDWPFVLPVFIPVGIALLGEPDIAAFWTAAIASGNFLRIHSISTGNPQIIVDHFFQTISDSFDSAMRLFPLKNNKNKPPPHP